MNPLVNRSQKAAYHHTSYIYKGNEPPYSIDHRGLAYQYNAYIYKGDGCPWSINHRSLAYYYTAYIYIERR